MKKHKLKKILLISLSVFVLLAGVLAVHIYMVTRPKAPSATTKVLARFDIKEVINQADADKITNWLYNQKGVDHVLCNKDARIAVFTYYPVKTNANDLAANMRSSLHYTVERYMPSKEEMQKGCPAMAGSVSSRISATFSNLFN